MTQLAEERVEQFTRLDDRPLKREVPWIDELRQAGLARFREVGFPTTKNEQWRQTNVAGIARTDFTLAGEQACDHVTELIGSYSFGNESTCELVYVNGHYNPKLSRHPHLPRGVRVGAIGTAIQRHPELMRRHLGQYANINANPFVALNTAFLQDGAFLHVQKGVKIEEPIHLLFIATSGERPEVSHPRMIVIVEDDAQVTLVKSYIGCCDGVYFTNSVTEVVAGANARVDLCKMQQECKNAYHVSTLQVQLGRNAEFVSHSATLGGKLTRNDLNVVLAGEEARATLNGVVILGGEQHCDNHTLLDHAKPHCPSHELYKHVLDGKSNAVFHGKILVRPDAQKTDSKQTSRTLLLSDEATMNSQPALEIYADDVKCTHGSTTGPVNEEMLFYLRSRGVSREAARHLLTYAFAADITRRIAVEPVRRRLEDFMAQQHGLPQDLRITDLGRHDEEHR